ncbi:hypothetical protein BGW37DRAFT_505768 [Umbelopsis sp. PMI_123]|nr:hypothetical protein BGW37DRAFT_505768 [Umbelopsis sp. PMI_123]
MSTTSRIPCKFYQQGRCLKGANCNFSHTIGTSNTSWGSKPAFGATATNELPKYNETSLKSDLSSQEKPIWDLSVYGPAKEEPNLIVGTDRSFEEDRLKYYLSRIQTGNENQFLQERELALQIMNQQVNAIVGDPTGAIRHFDGQKNKSSSAFGGSSNGSVNTITQFEPFRGNSGFGSGGGFGSSTSAFGNTGNAFGTGANTQPTSAFGGSAFGGSAFGNTSTANNTTPAFGSTGFGSSSSFGNMSQPTGSAFGNTGSAFGGTTANQPAFGTTSSMGGFGSTPSFGSTSAVGAQAQPNGMMGAATTPAFGATTAIGQNSAFGMSSQPSQPFGATQPTGGFGSISQPMTGFGAAATANTGFGSSFGLQPPQQQQPSTSSNTDDPTGQQAFLAPTFQYKMIPEQEPPVELR